MRSHNSAKRTVETLAFGAFAQHQLTTHRAFFWKCAREASWNYGFYVVIGPGAIGIYGDIGEAWFRMSERTEENVIGWLRGAIADPPYLLSKLANPDSWRTFYEDDALRWARQNLLDAKQSDRFRSVDRAQHLLDGVIEAMSDGILTKERWSELVHDAAEDTDVHQIATNWDSSAYWMVEALKTFIRLYDINLHALNSAGAAG